MSVFGGVEAKGTTSVLEVVGTVRMEEPYTDLRMADGKIVRLPTHMFMPAQVPDAPAAAGRDKNVIPVMEETLSVAKRVVETGKVVLRKSVEEREQALDVPLAVRTYEVERVALDRVVKGLPETRQEGATTVYPVVEERLVVLKELVLVEEIRVTERESERRDTRTVALKREHVEVERTGAAEAMRA